MVELKEKNYYNCRITKYTAICTVKHNITKEEIETTNLKLAYRIARLLDLEYEITNRL